MKRVAVYVDAYGERASIVVATERYRQETKGNTSATHVQRHIEAEFAIVRVDTVSGWLGFRDAVEVDGKPVTDRRDRLLRSLTDGRVGYAEARRLSDESARYNIGTIQRNFNVPTTALFYFTSQNQDRFKFSAKEVEKDGTWRIGWRETARPTLIRTPEGESVPSEGEIWVDPEAGTVLRTVLKTELQGLKRGRMQHGTGQVDVTYRLIDGIGMWLPEKMTERFEANGANRAYERVDGFAAYTNYRQFTTSVRIK